MTQQVLVGVLFDVVIVGVLVGGGVFLVVGLRRYVGRKRGAAAGRYGLRAASVPAAWLPVMPGYPHGTLRFVHAGVRGGRPVVLAEWKYTYVPVNPPRHKVSVAVVRLGTRHPPGQGRGRYASWQVVGSDLIATRAGVLDVDAMIPILDELLAVAAWLEPAPAG